MPHHEISSRDFQRIYEEQIKPDLDFRLGNLDELIDSLHDRSAFLEAFAAVMEELQKAKERREERWAKTNGSEILVGTVVNEAEKDGVWEEIDWNAVVGHTEVLAVIARKRCSVR